MLFKVFFSPYGRRNKTGPECHVSRSSINDSRRTRNAHILIWRGIEDDTFDEFDEGGPRERYMGKDEGKEDGERYRGEWSKQSCINRALMGWKSPEGNTISR